jgi:hypothetical protein
VPISSPRKNLDFRGRLTIKNISNIILKAIKSPNIITPSVIEAANIINSNFFIYLIGA